MSSRNSKRERLESLTNGVESVFYKLRREFGTESCSKTMTKSEIQEYLHSALVNLFGNGRYRKSRNATYRFVENITNLPVNTYDIEILDQVRIRSDKFINDYVVMLNA